MIDFCYFALSLFFFFFFFCKGHLILIPLSFVSIISTLYPSIISHNSMAQSNTLILSGHDYLIAVLIAVMEVWSDKGRK